MSKWIPVSKRLPKLNEEVLVTFRRYRSKKIEVTIGDWFQPDDKLYWLSCDGYPITVLAWQPLPPPYKEQK